VWPHHVGFVVGSAGPGRIREIGGNHNQPTDESVYATRSVMGILLSCQVARLKQRPESEE
jgi:hypothetical protein